MPINTLSIRVVIQYFMRPRLSGISITRVVINMYVIQRRSVQQLFYYIE